jgi:hypothetical protein
LEQWATTSTMETTQTGRSGGGHVPISCTNIYVPHILPQRRRYGRQSILKNQTFFEFVKFIRTFCDNLLQLFWTSKHS